MTVLGRISLAALCAAAVFLAQGAVFAQEVPKRRPMGTPAKPAAMGAPMASPAAASSETKVRKLELTLNRAEVITLSGRVREIVIGNPGIADVEIPEESEISRTKPTRIFVRPTAVGSTNVFFIGDNGDIIEQMEITVVFDSANIKTALRQLLPEENIDVSVFRDSVFLTGRVQSAASAANAVSIAGRFVGAAANVVNMMSVVGGQQVILKVRVAEMDRNVRKNLSTEGFTQLQSWSRGIQFSTVAPTFTDTSFATGTIFTGTNKIGDRTFEALERQSLAKTLAEPTLTAVSGESASFLSGGEFPFPSGLDENGQTIFEFREFGIRLEFTPVVIDKRRINLRVSTEISSIGDVALTTASLSINQIDSKRTETTIELPSGGVFQRRQEYPLPPISPRGRSHSARS